MLANGRGKDDLTPKQQAFSREYLVDFNATQAAIRAGYSEKTANEQAARLLVNVSVQAEIQKLTAGAPTSGSSWPPTKCSANTPSWPLRRSAISCGCRKTARLISI